MKKIILCSLIILLLSSCTLNASGKKTDKQNSLSEIEDSSIVETQMHVSVDEEYYSSMESLCKSSKGIFEGKVIGNHLEYIDDTDGSIVSETDDLSDDSYVQLYTIYDINITKLYKGDFSETSTVSLKILGDNKTIVFDNAIEFEPNEKYLFFVNYIEDSPAWLVSSTQSVYRLEDRNYVPIFDNNTISIVIDMLMKEVTE